MIFERIKSLLELCGDDKTLFPPKDLYNERWLMRLILDWFSNHKTSKHPLSITRKDKWYSDALLPSAFLSRYRGDGFAESHTHADGVIGHFEIGKERSADVSLLPDPTHFVVIVAKLFHRLSPGIKNASYYNQAARNIACITELMKRADQKPSAFKRLGFYVIAPRMQIYADVFKKVMKPNAIMMTVSRRVDEYDKPKEDWFMNWFLPTLDHIDVQAISWEDVLNYISGKDAAAGKELTEFYSMCLAYNQRVKKPATKDKE